MANLIFTLLVLAAAVMSLLTVGLLLAWLKGADALAFPGVGLIVATPLFILLLTACQAAVVIAAVFVARHRPDAPTIMSG